MSNTGITFLCNPTTQRLRLVVSHALDDTQSFSSTFSKEQSIARSQVFWSLYKTEGNGGTISSSDVGSVDVDDGAGLGDRSDMQHSLVLSFDGCCVGEDKYWR